MISNNGTRVVKGQLYQSKDSYSQGGASFIICNLFFGVMKISNTDLEAQILIEKYFFISAITILLVQRFQSATTAVKFK